MGFSGVYTALYDYAPQGEGELTVSAGDILYILEKGEDDWWKAKKRASEDDDDEPVGLVPANYVEEATPTTSARALFDYTRQTDEELSFSEDTHLEVFDTSDLDWILVGFEGEYGFAPANYIELSEGGAAPPATAVTRAPVMPARHVASSPEPEAEYDYEEEEPTPAQSPARALAGILGGRKTVAPPPVMTTSRPEYTPEASDEEPMSPRLPARPQSSGIESRSIPVGLAASPPHNRVAFQGDEDQPATRAPGGFRMYNINEMVSILGKKKKLPTSLGINLGTGTIMMAPEKARDGPEQEWTAEKLTHYSIEGKHVFLEFVRPTKSVDFHAGSKDTAREIDGVLRDLAGMVKAEGLKEIMMAATGSSQKTGKVLYDFMAQGDDEVTVAVDDEVVILDDTKSEEWWQIRRMRNGKEGVVPSSYIEITGSYQNPATAGLNAGRSTVQNNRLEEERLAKEALRASKSGDSRSEVGPGLFLPSRESSLSAVNRGNDRGQNRSKRESKSESSRSKSKPDPSKVRTWTDRSKSFSVDAQFLALKDGKINLHKMNGVKIAVPVAKMSVEDLEYVERMTGVSLDDEKPLSEIRKQQQARTHLSSTTSSAPAGASIEQPPEYDWFPFFLACEVPVQMCERYAQIFTRGSMDESVLPDVDAGILRNLGLREGDIIKVMRHLDGKFGRKKRDANATSDDVEGDGSLFSGAGGALKNNTRKGRPAPAVQTNDVVDASAFSQQDKVAAVMGPAASSSANISKANGGVNGGFDDDAWDVKPTKSAPAPAPAPIPAPEPTQPARPLVPAMTGGMRELSLLDAPLQPAPAPASTTMQPVAVTLIQQPTGQQQNAPLGSQATGANPAFFAGLNPQQTSNPYPQPQQFMPQQTGYVQQPLQTQQSMARQRPAAPQFSQGSGSLMIPQPPQRPLSAPQAPQQSSFGPPPLQPQMTGYQAQPAGPGQSLNDLNQLRLQQQYQQQMQPQMTGFGQHNGLISQPTGYGQFAAQQTGFNQQMQPQQTGFGQQSMQSPFADPRGTQFSPIQAQPSGFQPQSSFGQQQFPQATGVNAYLPSALEPQKTGMNGYGQGYGHQQTPQMPAAAPLLPQQTGPPPPVRFGVPADAKKLAPQATGRRANLAAATPQNPFGF